MSRAELSSRSPGAFVGHAAIAVATLACTPTSAPKSGADDPSVSPRPSATAAATRTKPNGAAFTQGAPPGSEWIESSRPNLRELTVIVRASPPSALGKTLRQLATRYEAFTELFTASAEGGFGSGFVMVRRSPADEGARVFVVTNRHVVGLASRVLVGFESDVVLLPVLADVAYVHDAYDLAVLALPPAVELREGFALAAAPPRDQDVVVASGYPGIGHTPSYQVTRGFVSNERYVFEDASGQHVYIQHSAPIDPGSSGGPLMTPDGKVLGINTLKVRGREAVGMAVPANVIAQALEEATREPKTRPLVACEAFLAKARGGEATLPALESVIGAALVAEHAVESLAELPGEQWSNGFFEDPIQVFVHAVALRLQRELRAANRHCTPAPTSTDSEPSFHVGVGNAARSLTFMREQGRWKLIHADLGPARERSFLDRFEKKKRAPAKPWKPSLR